MPDWPVTIKKDANNQVAFEPSRFQALIGDLVYWRNQDAEPHWPAAIENGQPNPSSFMSNQIPPGGVSSFFSPGVEGIIEYGCVLHPDERAQIQVLAKAPNVVTEAT
jgi:plastocyanin